MTLPSLAVTLRDQGIDTVRLTPVRSFVAEQPALQDVLAHLEPWLPSALSTLSTELPLPKAAGAFVDKPFYRPPGSHRCFYYYPSSLSESGSAGRAVIAFKGLEPCASEIEVSLRNLQRPCYSPHNIAEHLIFEEQKIPGCLGLIEAQREAQRALEIQIAHLSAYGSLARLPLPLLVFRHAPRVEQEMRHRLRRELSGPAFDTIDPWLAAGLGVYLYYYPSAPVRVRDVDSMLGGLAFQQRMFALMGLCDPEQVIKRWVQNFTRMLYLGVAPGSLASLRTGVSCQIQNACMDGGFVDLDSLTPLHALKDDTAVYAALQLSTDCLLQTIRALLAGSSDPTRSEGLEVRIDLHHFSQYLRALIRQAIDTEARQGLVLDARVAGYFAASSSFADLVSQLGTYYPKPNPEFLDSARGFAEFGMSLLTGQRNAQ